MRLNVWCAMFMDALTYSRGAYIFGVCGVASPSSPFFLVSCESFALQFKSKKKGKGRVKSRLGMKTKMKRGGKLNKVENRSLVVSG